MTRPKKVTKRQTERALAAVRKLFKSYLDAGYPEPVVGIAPWVGGDAETISWEEGPFEWAYLAAGVINGEDSLVPGVFVEPITSWQLGLYRED